MNVFRPGQSGRRIARRLTSLFVVVCLCAALVPWPVPTMAEKDSSQPFPCQHRTCGCRTASNCWNQCCCFTNSQKVAWARAKKAPIPQFVEIAAREERTSGAAAPAACCARKPSRPSKPVASTPTPAKDHIPVTLAAMTECQGQPWSWNSLPWTVLSQPCATPSRLAALMPGRAVASEDCDRGSRRPPVPPPRA